MWNMHDYISIQKWSVENYNFLLINDYRARKYITLLWDAQAHFWNQHDLFFFFFKFFGGLRLTYKISSYLVGIFWYDLRKQNKVIFQVRSQSSVFLSFLKPSLDWIEKWNRFLSPGESCHKTIHKVLLYFDSKS